MCLGPRRLSVGDPLRHRVLVSGQVQGVGFRAATAHKARALDVRGYVSNLGDGRVEIMMCGKAEAVRTLLEWLHEGPSAARVREVVVADTRVDDADWPSRFLIR